MNDSKLCKNCLHPRANHFKYVVVNSRFVKIPCNFKIPASGEKEENCNCERFREIPQGESSIFFEDNDDYIVRTADRKIYRIRIILMIDKSYWQIKEESISLV